MQSDNVILMVEDNPDFVELARRAFRKNNFSNPVVVAEDGVEALDYLFAAGNWAGRDPETNPILVLLDLKLPRVSGLEVLRRMRSDPRTKCLPVVILTSSAEEQDIVNGYNLGCNSYIRKPVDFMKLTEILGQLGLYWMVINEPPRAEWRE